MLEKLGGGTFETGKSENSTREYEIFSHSFITGFEWDIDYL
jgi:hypothetical protein